MSAAERARELWNKGYRVTSRKFRIISRVDVDLKEFAGKDAQRNCLLILPRESAEEQYRRVWSKDTKTLDREDFEAFLKIKREEEK